MIVIKNIEVLKTIDDSPIKIVIEKPDSKYTDIKGNAGDDIFTHEIVYGRKFVKKDGSVIVIGMTKYVQEIIGIQYEAWDNLLQKCSNLRLTKDSLERNLSRVTKEMYQYKAELDYMKRAGFFRRLKYFLFKR